MHKRIFSLLLILLLLLPVTTHADVIFLSPQGLRNRFTKEKSVILPVEEREYIALTDLTGWQHPHTRRKVCTHAEGTHMTIHCLYTDEYGTVWAYHRRYDGPGCNCWVPYEGIAPVKADPLPQTPAQTLPTPRPTRLTLLMRAALLIAAVVLLTRFILHCIKRKTAA